MQNVNTIDNTTYGMKNITKRKLTRKKYPKEGERRQWQQGGQEVPRWKVDG